MSFSHRELVCRFFRFNNKCVVDRIAASLLLKVGIALSCLAQPALAETIWYFPSTNNETFEGYLWLSNLTDSSGEVTVTATDDGANTHPPLVLELESRGSLELSASLLEEHNKEEGTDELDTPMGDWRLTLTSDLKLEVLTYARTEALLLVPMHPVVPSIANVHRVPNFRIGEDNPFSSQLRIVNDQEDDAEVKLTASNVIPDVEAVSFELELGAGKGYRIKPISTEETTSSRDESSCEQNECGLALQSGVWELQISSNVAIEVMHLGVTENGQISNLSSQPNLIWRDLIVAPESRCATDPYRRSAYGERYRSKESDIQEALGGIFSPYTLECFGSLRETEIEHIVALAEAHNSGMCEHDTQTKRTFGGDLLNLTLADSVTNRTKSSRDAFDWLPEENKCWFADRVLKVRQEFGLSVDPDEAAALEELIATCDSFELEVPACAR